MPGARFSEDLREERTSDLLATLPSGISRRLIGSGPVRVQLAKFQVAEQAASPWFWRPMGSRGEVGGEQVGDVRGGFPALGDVFGDDGGIEAGVDDLHSVEPVLDAIAAQDEARVVDITDRPRGRFRWRIML